MFNRNVFLPGTSLAVGYSGIDPPSLFLFPEPSFLPSPSLFPPSPPLNRLETSTENFEERFVSTYTTDHGNF